MAVPPPVFLETAEPGPGGAALESEKKQAKQQEEPKF
jgi:hypothetical protein